MNYNVKIEDVNYYSEPGECFGVNVKWTSNEGSGVLIWEYQIASDNAIIYCDNEDKGFVDELLDKIKEKILSEWQE